MKLTDYRSFAGLRPGRVSQLSSSQLRYSHRLAPLKPCVLRATPERQGESAKPGPMSLSDLLAFESDLATQQREDNKDAERKKGQEDSGEQDDKDADARAQAVVERAAKALESVRSVLGESPGTQQQQQQQQPQQQRSDSRTSSSEGTSSSRSSSPVIRPSPATDTNRFAASSRLGTTLPPKSPSPSSAPSPPSPPSAPSPKSSSSGRPSPQQLQQIQQQLQQQRRGASTPSSSGGDSSGPSLMPKRLPTQQEQEQRQLAFAEPEWWPAGGLQLASQEEQDAVAARSAVLPPLQSVMELTSAYKPPTRQFEPALAGQEQAQAQAAPEVGRQLEDGTGVLADGTKWEKKTEEILGQFGFRKLITTLRGWTVEGQVAWQESWWEASDWAGLRELGADKTGSNPLGAAWRETWCEKAYHDETTLELKIERSAHKWSRTETGSEWEEEWGEKHAALGEVNKYADKWAKEGDDVWHERWGEDYDGKGSCKKWTDKWAEHMLPGGGNDQWGDKWTEEFGHGKGVKHGEVWSVNPGGERYNRWWNEQHYGNGQVRRWGNSTHGEYWDATDWMDTYYNPVPHFGFDLAVRHSPNLWQIPVRPGGRKSMAAASKGTPGEGDSSTDDDTDDLGMGLGALD